MIGETLSYELEDGNFNLPVRAAWDVVEGILGGRGKTIVGIIENAMRGGGVTKEDLRIPSRPT